MDREDLSPIADARVELLAFPPAAAPIIGRMLRIGRVPQAFEGRARPVAVTTTDGSGAFRFEGVREGSAGRMHIAIECHACFEWLFPVLERFRQNWGEVDVDIRPGLAFDALPALQKEEVDLVVSSDPEDLTGVTFKPLFDYEPVFVASSQHPLAQKDFVVAEDFRDEL